MIFPFCTLNKSEYPEVSPKANGSPVDIGSEYRGKELETPLINGVISPIHDSPLLLHPLSNMKRSNNNLTGQTMHPDQHFMHNPDSNIHPRVRRHLNFGCNEGFILHEEYSEKSLILNGGKDFKDSIDMGGDDNKDNNREMIIEFSDTFHKEGIHYYSKADDLGLEDLICSQQMDDENINNKTSLFNPQKESKGVLDLWEQEKEKQYLDLEGYLNSPMAETINPRLFSPHLPSTNPNSTANSKTLLNPKPDNLLSRRDLEISEFVAREHLGDVAHRELLEVKEEPISQPSGEQELQELHMPKAIRGPGTFYPDNIGIKTVQKHKTSILGKRGQEEMLTGVGGRPLRLSLSPNIQANSSPAYSHYPLQYNSGNAIRATGAHSKATRNTRGKGLRVLSVRVRELVFSKRETSYKEVADQLIEELAIKGKIIRGNPSHPNGSTYINKEEKNVRRRVYDALNVLIAAGVIKRNGKSVYYDGKSKFLMEKCAPNLDEVAEEIEKIQKQIAMHEDKIEQRKAVLKEIILKSVAIHNLMRRNKEIKLKLLMEGIRPENNFVKFPFIIVFTPDTPDNSIAIRVNKEKTQFNLCFKREINLMGDIDTLLQLGLHKLYNSNPLSEFDDQEFGKYFAQKRQLLVQQQILITTTISFGRKLLIKTINNLQCINIQLETPLYILNSQALIKIYRIK